MDKPSLHDEGDISATNDCTFDGLCQFVRCILASDDEADVNVTAVFDGSPKRHSNR